MLDWGITVVLWLQQFSPNLDGFFRAVTHLGGEEFVVVAVPLVYWSLDRRTGIRLAVLAIVSGLVNGLAKLWADQPRPFAYDDQVVALTESGSLGFPSGHAQLAVVVWGYLAASARRSWSSIVAVAAVVLVGLSRLYLGVHFPTDVVGGYLIGLGLLLVFLAAWPAVERRLQMTPVPALLLIPALPAGLVLVVRWSETGGRVAGALLGLGLGVLWERRHVGFDTAGSPRQRVLRMLLGGPVLAALWLSPLPVSAGAELLRYLLAGAWVAAGAPWLFVRVGLAPASLDSPDLEDDFAPA